MRFALVIRSQVLLGCLLIGLSLPTGIARATDDLATVTPGGAVFFVEIAGLESWIDKLQQSPLVSDLPSNPQVQAFYASSQGRKFDATRKLIETQLGMDLWSLSKTLFGGHVAAAFYPHEGRKEPDAVVIAEIKDVAALDRIRERIAPLLTLTEDQTRISAGPGGVSVRAIDNKLFIAEKVDWIVLASTSELMTQALSLRASDMAANEKPLSSDAPYAAMLKQVGRDHLVRSFLNVELISQAMHGRMIPEKLDNGVVSLLMGGTLDLLARSPFLGSTLDLDEHSFRLSHEVTGKPESLGEKFQWFFADATRGGAAPLPNIPELIGGLVLNRDFAGWYKRREELLDAKVLPEFDKFEGGLANILPNRDFGTNILPTIGRNLTFVAVPQSYSHLNGKPGLQLPGFALIVDLAQPEDGAEVLTLFFQTLSAIVNLNAGQQGRQPWVLSSETYKDVQITFGKYGQKPKGDRLPIVFNFMPSAARVGDKFVMSSSVDLCRSVIDSLQSPSAATGDRKNAVKPNSGEDFRFDLTGDTLSKALDLNRELIEAKSIQGGKSAEQAKSEVSLFLEIVRAVRSVQLTSGPAGDGYRVRLEADWK